MQHIIFTTQIKNLNYNINMYKSEHFTDSLFYQVELTAKYCRSLGVQVFTKLNMPLTVEEFSAMDVIMLHKDICQRELAKIILKDRPNTGRILNSLEEKGYIKRFADTKNNRLVRKMMITDEGEKVFKYVSDILREHLSKIPKIISEEEKAFVKIICKKLREGLKQEVEMKI